MWAPEACLLARRSAEIIYKAFQDPSDPSGSAKMAHRATNLSYFTIIRHCQESPSHSIFGADGAKKQVAMEQPRWVRMVRGELATPDLRQTDQGVCGCVRRGAGQVLAAATRRMVLLSTTQPTK